jgi:hypothetical protein
VLYLRCGRSPRREEAKMTTMLVREVSLATDQCGGASDVFVTDANDAERYIALRVAALVKFHGMTADDARACFTIHEGA